MLWSFLIHFIKPKRLVKGLSSMKCFRCRKTITNPKWLKTNWCSKNCWHLAFLEKNSPDPLQLTREEWKNLQKPTEKQEDASYWDLSAE